MSPEFLSKVKALQNQIQWEYDQYKLRLHSEQYIEKDSEKYIQLIIQEVDLNDFRTSEEEQATQYSQNCKLPQRD
jgi:uncharacterized membrane protein YgaE (UPF0421/DUF939 family)